MHNAFEQWGNRLVDMMNTLAARMNAMEARVAAEFVAMGDRLVAMGDRLVAMEARLTDELRRGTKASEEGLTTRLRVIDDKYKDLPARMDRVEAKLLAAPKRKRR
ncbi:MAG TPA: hypothetical protein VIV11_20085 [Kofleriaceae bacterium]